MSENNNEWKISTSEFMGYVRGRLEDINFTLKKIEEKVDKHTNQITYLKVRTGLIAGAVSVIITIGTIFLRKFM